MALSTGRSFLIMPVATRTALGIKAETLLLTMRVPLSTKVGRSLFFTALCVSRSPSW